MDEDIFDQSGRLQSVLPNIQSKVKLSSATTYTIGGVTVEFPVKAYPSQISMMNQVIQGCSKGKNCLLESPTGSGKTLALLCSVLAWQKKEKESALQMLLQESLEKAQKRIAPSTPTKISKQTNPVPKSLHSNDSMIIEIEDSDEDDFQPKKKSKISISSPSPSMYSSSSNMDISMSNDVSILHNSTVVTQGEEITASPGKSTSNVSEVLRIPKVSKIFYGTRTHKQISQIVRELRKTVYGKDIRMTILSSRKHTCINEDVLSVKKGNLNDLCQDLKETEGKSCNFFATFKKILPPELGGKVHGLLPTVWDIEEFVDAGKKLCACPYYAAREIVNTADIIFCPYNYIIDPLIRKSMDLDVNRSIILLDEAHNIEDVSRDSAGCSFDLNVITSTQQECEQAASFNHNLKSEYTNVAKFLSTLGQWMYSKRSEIQDDITSMKGTVNWTGIYVVASFISEGIGPEQYSNFKHWIQNIYRDDDELKSNTKMRKMKKVMTLNARSKSLLSGLDFVLGLLYSGTNADDYHVCMESGVATDEGEGNRWYKKNKTPTTTKYTLHFWCLNSSLVFADIRDSARSVILTSGTLAPMDSFQSELGTQFPVKLEANHVVDKDQVFVNVLGQGPRNIPLTAVYKNTLGYDFQDELGRLILDVCNTVPYGVLCFLSSYSFLDKLMERWSCTGLMDKLQEIKQVVCEPRRNDQLEDVMLEYFTAIKRAESKQYTNKITGALLFTIFRGKISEGIDFADNYARTVISVGIPYPSIQDEKVKLKRAYNDTHSFEKGLLKGGDWYQIQAYRALNQALGRCIRHRYDWGAILLVDQRFYSKNSQNGLSKWVRNQVQSQSNHKDFIQCLKRFVENRMRIQADEDRMKKEEENLREDIDPSEDVTEESTQDTQDSVISENTINFTMDKDNHVIVYTDGACSKNGQAGATAGCGVYFGDNNPLNLSAPVDKATNNSAEIQGAINALRQAKTANIDKVCIKTDSKFLMQCAEEWMPKWETNGWKKADGKPVQNREELQELSKEMRKMTSVKWEHVPGHSNVYGNEKADKLARDACK